MSDREQIDFTKWAFPSLPYDMDFPVIKPVQGTTQDKDLVGAGVPGTLKIRHVRSSLFSKDLADAARRMVDNLKLSWEKALLGVPPLLISKKDFENFPVDPLPPDPGSRFSGRDASRTFRGRRITRGFCVGAKRKFTGRRFTP